MAMSYTKGYDTNRLIRSLYARKAVLEDKMNDVAAKGAEDIKNLSVAYSPVDEGHVEEAHKVVVRSTRRGAPAYDVIIDESVADVAEYVDWLHNDPTYELGPLSQLKADATGMPVGYKFLERAFDALKPEIVLEYRKIAKEFTK